MSARAKSRRPPSPTTPTWEAVYQDNATWVYGTIFARVGNQADAEDLTAEVFLAELPLRLTASIAEVRAYLRATAGTVLAARRPAVRAPHVFTAPGEHDSVDDAGQKYRQAFGAGTRGDG